MMRKCALLALALLGLILPGLAVAQGFQTPEDAIKAYVQAVSQRDFKGVLAATAVGKLGKSYDFVATVERVGAATIKLPAPATDPFFAEMNDVRLADSFARQVKGLVYGLMTTGEFLAGETVPMDAAGAKDLMTVLDAKRLANLSIAAIGIPNPKIMNGEKYLANSKRRAKTYGADDATERVVLLSFEGLDFMIAFDLLRYGDDWMILSQSSAIAGTNSMGVPRRITPDEFRALVQ